MDFRDSAKKNNVEYLILYIKCMLKLGLTDITKDAYLSLNFNK